MQLFLGNNQDIVLDLNPDDEIFIYPTACARGGYWDIKNKNTYLATCFDGIKSSHTYFKYSSEDEKKTAEQSAKEHYELNNKNNIDTIVKIKASEVNESIAKNYRYVQPLEDFPDFELSIDPYLFGLYVGAKVPSKQFTIRTDNSELVSYIKEFTSSKSLKLSIHKNDYTIYDLPVYDKIPEEFIKNSKEKRVMFLSGIMDTCGTLDKNVSVFTIMMSNKELLDDIKTLCNGLGFFTRIADKNFEGKAVSKRLLIYINYNTPELLCKTQTISKDKIKSFNGIKISLNKTKEKYRNQWTDEMVNNLEDIVKKYTKNNRVKWSSIIQNEKLYEKLTADAVKTYYNKTLKKI